MKITKRQLRRIIREEKKALTESFNSMSPRSRSLANAARRQFAKDYPDVQVSIDGREGWIVVNGKKAVNMSQASGRPLSIEDIIDQMKQAYLGHDMLSQEVPELTGGRRSSWQVRKERELGESVKITKRQLKRIIKEEKAKLNEISPAGIHGTNLADDEAYEKQYMAAMQDLYEALETALQKAKQAGLQYEDVQTAWDDASDGTRY